MSTAICGALDPPNVNWSWSVNEPKSPPAAKGLSVIARRLARSALNLPLFFGWLLTKIGGTAFDLGADLETWARNKRREL